MFILSETGLKKLTEALLRFLNFGDSKGSVKK